MSSTMVFVFGILSLSISALATSRISKRRANARAARNRNRPLILPWLVSSDSTTRKRADGRSQNSSHLINHPSEPHQELGRPKPVKSCASQAINYSPTYSPYIDQPTNPLPSSDDGDSLEESWHSRSPIEANVWARVSRSPRHCNTEELSLPKEIFPKRLSFNSLATTSDFDSYSARVTHPKCHFLDRRDSLFSNRDSMSSISSTFYSEARDSVLDAEEIQKLEFVIGSGHRLQARYCTLSSPGSEFQISNLTPIKRAQQFD